MKARGARATVRAFVQRFVFARRTWIITECRLPGLQPEPDPDGIVYRRATDDDLGRLDTLRPHRDPAELRERIRDEGCRLHIGCDGSRVVAFRLAGPEPARNLPIARVLRLDRFLGLGDREIFIYETFCHPDYRNRGIGRRISLASDQMLAEDGFRRQMSMIRSENIPSLLMSFRKGTRPILHVSYVRLLFYRRCTVSPQVPSTLLAMVEQATSAPDGGGPRPSDRRPHREHRDHSPAGC